MELATAILGILGRVSEGISAAIIAARAEKEDDAFAILEETLKDAAVGVGTLRAKVAANKAEAEKALAEKFDETTKP